MEKKGNNYAYIAIVAIVAIVALVMLFSTGGERSKTIKLDSSVEGANVGGQAINIGMSAEGDNNNYAPDLCQTRCPSNCHCKGSITDGTCHWDCSKDNTASQGATS